MAKRKKKRIASRGSVNNTILRTLVNGDKYGYEIIKEVEEYSQGKISLKQPSLYSSLSRFEDKGIVNSYWEDSDLGGRRHYYHLTEKGYEYYRINVLKEVDEDNSSDQDESLNETNNLPLDNNVSAEDVTDYLESSNETTDDCNNNLSDNDNLEYDNNTLEDTNETISMQEIDEESLPAIAQFDVEQKEEIIPDHKFYTKTPIDQILTDTQIIEENNQEIIDDSEKISTVDVLANSNPLVTTEDEINSKRTINDDNNNVIEETEINNEIEYPWLELASIAKKTRDKISDKPLNKLYLKQRPKAKKVILDSDGIYKLRDEDYVPTPKLPKNKPIIIDNVGKRTNNQTTYSYTTYSDTSKNVINNELSEEEKRRKNENFVAKFNMLTMSRMKPVSTPVQQQKEQEKEIDYRGKLDNIIENNRVIEERNRIIEEQHRIQEENRLQEEMQQNNLFNYTDDDEEDNFIDFEPVEEFETKKESNEYVSKITNYSIANEDIKINRYETKSNAVLMDKTYILINRLRFVFGIIMSILIAGEVLITQAILRSNNMIGHNDNIVFILAYSLIGVLLIVTTIPLIISHNEHKCNNYKFKYAFWFGLLTFLVLSIIVYCVNALIGFELEYFTVFATKLIVPIVLAFNFVLGPIVYYLLTKVPKFYD